MSVGRLVSASTTTGWTDWIHGELWILPDGILRVALDLQQTRAHGVRRTVPDAPRTHSFDDAEIKAALAANSRNIWVAAERIARASLRRGLMTGRLRLWLKDGGSYRFLWLVGDKAEEPLREALTAWGVEI